MANPVLKLEVMRRFRSPLAAWGIPLAIALPGLAVVLAYRRSMRLGSNVTLGMLAGFEGDITRLDSVGKSMFAWVVGLLVVTILLLVPSTLSGSISGERHAQTFQPLQLSLMSPTQIVLGKLTASLAYLIVLLLCAAPAMAIPFLLGGVPTTVVIGTFVALILFVVELAAIALAVSATFTNPVVSNVVALLACGFVTIGPFIAGWVFAALAAASNPNFRLEKSLTRYLAHISPLSLSAWVIDTRDNFRASVIRPVDRWGSLAWFLLITVTALLWARRKVTAPVERDR